MTESLKHLFSFVCGQVNVWAPGGVALPLCQRCTGLYAGGAYAATIVALFLPRPTGRILWAHGIAMLLMVPFGYHLLPQTAVARTITGQLFASGLVYYLVLNPADRWHCWRDRSLRLLVAYWIALLAGIPLLLAGVIYGSASSAAIIVFLSVVGLVIFLVLVLLNFYVFALFGLERWREARAL